MREAASIEAAGLDLGHVPLDCREKLMPLVPMLMPSDTPMVLKR